MSVSTKQQEFSLRNFIPHRKHTEASGMPLRLRFPPFTLAPTLAGRNIASNQGAPTFPIFILNSQLNSI